ncbi:hypothetical protein FGB62_113g16 [Gracilaria domingensis]|nr:hypothetical protein FGB62_113g16 [Gracilaria domingensis]
MHHFDKERKLVEVETRKGPLKGFLHVIDPESATLVVQSMDSVVILSQAAVVSLKQIKADDEELAKYPLMPFESQRDPKPPHSCEHLLEEFRKRMIDAKVILKDGEQHISLFDGAAWIMPPYDRSSSFSENETVLMRLHQLLSDIADPGKGE